MLALSQWSSCFCQTMPMKLWALTSSLHPNSRRLAFLPYHSHLNIILTIIDHLSPLPRPSPRKPLNNRTIALTLCFSVDSLWNSSDLSRVAVHTVLPGARKPPPDEDEAAGDYGAENADGHCPGCDSHCVFGGNLEFYELREGSKLASLQAMVLCYVSAD